MSACGSNKRGEAEGTDDPAEWKNRAWQSAEWDVLEAAAWFAVLAGLPEPWSVRSECNS